MLDRMKNFVKVALYVRDEGGYAPIMRALKHYKLRLRTISKSPELENAAMFVQILQQESAKTLPAVDTLLEIIPSFLYEPWIHVDKLTDGALLMKKAVDSYCIGIQRAIESKSPYYTKLLGDLATREEFDNMSAVSKKLAGLLE